MQEDLERKTSIQFPTVTNTSNDVTSVFGSMTPMIEIPSAVVLRQLEEGMCVVMHKYIHVCVYSRIRMYICMYSSCYFLLKYIDIIHITKYL